MQQTNFPFVAVVHDDCSTDNSAAIIHEYAEKYPNIIKPVFETENQYSKHDGSLRRAMDAACEKYGAKYYALCEGDDYWTDPHKLQKQVEFMETHPDYTMVCSDAVVRTPDGDMTEEDFRNWSWKRYHESRDMAVEDIIEEGGLFIHTASIVYRNGIRNAYPDACWKCHVGDYPLQIMAALQGKVYYFHEKMAVYRLGWGNSFTAREKCRATTDTVKKINTEILALEAMDAFSKYQYTASFHRIATRIVLIRCARYPYLIDEILSLMGHTLHYNYVAPYISSINATRDSIWLHLLKRICFRPYYPFTKCNFLQKPGRRFVYEETETKQIFYFEAKPLLSIIGNAPEQEIYLLNHRIK